jgi:hypothetical protein
MSRPVQWLLAALPLAAVVGVAAWALRERAAAGVGLPAGSVFSRRGNGLAEAAEVLRGLGYEPVALTRPVRPSQRGLLLLVAPTSLGDADARHLLAWVAAGNTLLFASDKPTPLHEQLGVEVGATDDDTPVLVEPEEAGAYTEGVTKVRVSSARWLRGDAGLPLCQVRGRPVWLLLRHGKGRVVLMAEPSPLTWRGLSVEGQYRDNGNVVFLANLADLHAAGGVVWFDEYHHGVRAATGFWGYLAYHGRRLVMLPLALLVVVAGWRVAVRLGPAVPTPQTTQADAVDYASGLGRLYRQAGARRHLARALARGFLLALTQFLRLRRSALPLEVLAAWRQHDAGPSLSRLQELLRGVGELRRGAVTDRQLLAWARAFDQFQAEVLHAT